MYEYLILSVSAKDIFHEAVKKALQKEQWVITDDPLKFKFGNVNFQIDLGAERLVAAERAGEKIAVEDQELSESFCNYRFLRCFRSIPQLSFGAESN